MIAQGQALPAGTLSQQTKDGTVNHKVAELFAGKKSYCLPCLVRLLQRVLKRIYLAMWY